MEDIQHMLQALGSNKVHLMIVEDPRFVQTCKQTTATHAQDTSAVFSRIPNPYQMYEQTRVRRNSGIVSNNKCAAYDIAPQQRINATPPLHPPPPPTPQSSSPKIQGNSFMYHVLCIIDPLVTVMNHTQVQESLFKFKTDLAKHLGNEKQLFKQFGFSKKKSVTLESMQANLQETNTDLVLFPESLLYIAKLTKLNISICNAEDHTRQDIQGNIVDSCPTGASWYMFEWKNGQYKVHDIQDTHDLLNAYISLTFKETFKNIQLENLDKSKATDLKMVYKFITGACKAPLTKVELCEYISRALKN